MNRQQRNTWILVGVVALLGMGAIAEQVRERLTAPKPLLALAPGGVREVVIECPLCTKRRFERVRGRWEMAVPYRLPADAAQVQRLLDVAAAPVRSRHPATHYQADKIGLAAPLATLTLGGLRIEFGTTDPLTAHRFVRVRDQVALIPDRVTHLLLGAPEAFVDPRPFRPLHDLARVRDADGEWTPERRAALEGLVAARVAAAPAGAGRALEVGDSRGHTLGFSVVRGPDALWLVRRDLPIAYALPLEQAARFDAR
jgi:hypothetical protein